MAIDLEMITVHSDETLPFEYAPETHGISNPILWGDGKRLAYVAPLGDLERLGGNRDPWKAVFQIVSDHPDWFTRDAIKALEEARDSDGAGPS
jgi:hypothetical protein